MKNVEIDLHFGFYLGSYAKAKVNDGRRHFFIGSKKCQHVLCEGLTEMKRVSGPERLTIILTEDTVLLMKVKVVQSCPDTLQPHGLYSPWNSPGQNTEVGSLSLLQGIFPTWGSHTGLPHYRQTLYQLSHQRSPPLAISCPLHLFLPESMQQWAPNQNALSTFIETQSLIFTCDSQ